MIDYESVNIYEWEIIIHKFEKYSDNCLLPVSKHVIYKRIINLGKIKQTYSLVVQNFGMQWRTNLESLLKKMALICRGFWIGNENYTR